MAKKSNGLGYIRKLSRQKGTYYQAVICLGYNENGKQITKSKGSYNLQEVRNWLKEMNNKTFTPETKMTVIDYVYKYIEENKKKNIKEVTYEQYLTRTRLHLKPYPLSDMEVGDITPTSAIIYLNELLKNTSAPIHNYMLMLLKRIFVDLHDDGLIQQNPVGKINPIKYKKELRNSLTKKEQELIMGELDLSDKRDLAIFLAFNTGCRIGEIMGLKWENISNSGIVSITKQFSRIEKADFEETSLKTINSFRENPLPSKAFTEIEKYRGTGYIFSDNGEKPFDRKRVQRRYKEICEKHNIKSTFRSIRHTFITRLYEAGVSPKTAQILAGHSDIKTTLNIYTHVSEEQKRNSVQALEDLTK